MNIHVLRRASHLVAFLSASIVLTACAAMSDGMMPAKVADGAMTNTAGMTLYTFDKDTVSSGKSVCNGPCVAIWPAFGAPSEAKAAAGWSVVTRDDGSRQWAYKGKPLYLFARDAKPGDRTGDGFNNNLWHIARP